MERVFSVGDIADQFWSPPPPPIRLPHPLEDGSSSSSSSSYSSSSSSVSKALNRSFSEWAFQRFIQELSASSTQHQQQPSPPSMHLGNDVVDVKDHSQDQSQHPTVKDVETRTNTTPFAGASVRSPPNIPIDSDEYQAFLKSQLNLACAAVALTRASYIKSQNSAPVLGNGLEASSTSTLGSQVPSKGSGCDKGQDKDSGQPLGIPALPSLQKNHLVQVKSTSGSSRELSDDEEAEGEAETDQDMDPADAKRVRRMLSNRESARRSRRRKQTHLTELETQVSQLKVENSSLMKRFTDISQKYNEAAVDNRVLKADVETLRAKVKMAEVTVKRVTGLNPLLQPMPEMSTMSTPFFYGSPSETSSDANVPVQEETEQHFYQPVPKNPISTNNTRVQNGLVDIPSGDNVQQNPAKAAVGGNKMGRIASMQSGVGVQILVEPRAVEGSNSDKNADQ